MYTPLVIFESLVLLGAMVTLCLAINCKSEEHDLSIKNKYLEKENYILRKIFVDYDTQLAWREASMTEDF